MRNIISMALGVSLAAMLAGCNDDDKMVFWDEVPGATDNGDQASAVEKDVKYLPEQAHQTIVGFGASDCWMGPFVGQYWTTRREMFARWLFSRDTDKNGNPEGIGLSMWRVNVGAGSYQQGDASDISPKDRRSASFMELDGTWNWNAVPGRIYFMDRAREAGVESMVLFANSPHVRYTYNGLARSDRGAYSNLRSDAYTEYADYLATVVKHFEDAGYPITHISPFNEPQWSWSGHDQEGSGWTNGECARLVRELDAALTRAGAKAAIVPGECGSYEYIYGGKGKANKVVEAFFRPGGANYIGDLPHVHSQLCAHSYWTETSWDGMRKSRRQTLQACERLGVELWQSEYSMLADNDNDFDDFPGFSAASEMDMAMYLSRVIHNDLTVANVTSWCYWVAMDISHWGHKNRFNLITMTPQGGEWGDVEAGDGTAYANPNLWVLGNYSRFVRPGYRRVDMELNDNQRFFGSAYLSPDGKTLVAVYTNYGNKPIAIAETEIASRAQSIDTYTTTATAGLTRHAVEKDERPIISAKSVTTVVYQL